MREDMFANTNCFDGIKMEPLNSTTVTPEWRRAARINAMAIESNILKLVRIVGKKEVRDKLQKEFGQFKNNEIGAFKGSYERMKHLYMFKNGTSKEEYDTV